jgi:hypothetical protein
LVQDCWSQALSTRKDEDTDDTKDAQPCLSTLLEMAAEPVLLNLARNNFFPFL